MTPNPSDDTLRRAAEYLTRRGTEYLEQSGLPATAATAGAAPQRRRLRLIVGGAVGATVIAGSGLAAAITGTLPVPNPFTAFASGEPSAAADTTADGAASGGNESDGDGRADGDASDATTRTTPDESPDGNGVTPGIRLPRIGLGSDRSDNPTSPEPPLPPVDGVGPVISDVVANPVVNAGTTLRVSWTVDEASPAQNPWMIVGGPPGFVPWCPFPTYATVVGGFDNGSLRFEASCAVPLTVPDGNYTAFIGAVDGVGNRSEVAVDFVIVGGSSDAQAPVVSEVVLASASASPGGTVVVRWRVSDETLVTDTYPMVLGPNGSFITPTDGTPWTAWTMGTLVTGTPQNGIYEATLRLSPFATEGVYTLWFGARDGLGNRMFEQAVNGERGYGTFEVSGDIGLPVIR